MILRYLSSVWGTAAPAVANHLWQSTLFAAVVGLLALLLRKDQARLRYWLWLAASPKFLVPFALLVSLGSVFAVAGFHNERQATACLEREQVSQPFVRPAATLIPAAVPRVAPFGFTELLPALFVAVWLSGFLIVLFTWYIRGCRMSEVLASEIPLLDGKEVETLRRLEHLAAVRKHIPVFLSRASLEPGIFGVFPAELILLEWICERLSEKHFRAVLAHEVWHVRRRDNLTAAVHRVVQALFWFHPLVWWLGSRRLVEERERTCDEQVLKLGNAPQIYAESILRTCELCVESPLACASGVTGADLNKRIVRIMKGGARHKLSARKKLLLGVTGCLALTLPLGYGSARGKRVQANSPQNRASSLAGNMQPSDKRFEVASIKPNKSGSGGMALMMEPGRFTATNIPIRLIIKFAYNLQSDAQLTGGPGWINSEKYDIEGKESDSFVESMKGHSFEEAAQHTRLMVQSMLVDRFNLKLKREMKKLPVYALIVASHGPKLAETRRTPLPRVGGKFTASHEFRGIQFVGLGHIKGSAATTGLLADELTKQLGRLVVDDTGLKGHYDFVLKWTPEENQKLLLMRATGGNPTIDKIAPAEPSSPSIFTAVQEQLGLKLKAERAPVDVLVIEHIDRPSAN